MSTKKCIIKYIIHLCLMIVQSMIMTLIVANITVLRNVLQCFFYPFVVILFLGAILIAVLIFVHKLEDIFPVDYMAALSVIATSSGLAVVTWNLKLWVLLSWLLTIFLAAITVTLGYLMKRLSEKWFYIVNYVISGLMLVSAFMFVILYSLIHRNDTDTVFGVLLALSLLLALFLNGQSLKHCDDSMANSFLPVRLALATWSLMALLYLFISLSTQQDILPTCLLKL
uniref:Uncharacterized protein n=1 Tax=Trichobilharzia regenti TaxID=157069 RepID=A0AA85J2L6_TRIRE|nr:unnamed protein product [Trichobilharzia regenti]